MQNSSIFGIIYLIVNTFYDRKGHTVSSIPVETEIPEWYPDFAVDTPGQRLAAEAIRNWIRVSQEIGDIESLANDSDWGVPATTLSAEASAHEYIGDMSDFTDEQRACAIRIIGRFREYPGFLLDRYDFSDIPLGNETLGKLHRSHFLKIVKAFTVDPDSQDLGVVKIPTHRRPVYWLREDIIAKPPTETLVSARTGGAALDEHKRVVRHEKAAEQIVDLIRTHPNHWFVTKDLHPRFFDESVSLETQDWRIRQALERIASHPEYGPHFREDRIESGRVRRFWYAEDPTDFELPYAAYADRDAPEREFDPNQKVDRRRVEFRLKKSKPETAPLDTPEVETLSWEVVFNEDGTGRVGSSGTKDALVLHIVDIVAKSTASVRIETLMARLKERGLNPTEHGLQGALKYIQAWLPKNHAERWRDETSEDRNGRLIRRLQIDKSRKK